MEKLTFRVTKVSRTAFLRLARSNGPGFPDDVEYLSRSQTKPKIIHFNGSVVQITADRDGVEIAIFARAQQPAKRAAA